MFKSLTNIFRVQELRDRILYTVMAILVYRIGSHIPTPGIDPAALLEFLSSAQGGGGLLTIMDLFSGGALFRFSILALGIMPYISASIIMQLLGVVIPALERMQKEGESGRKKINQYVRYLALVLCIIQSAAMASWIQSINEGAMIYMNPGLGFVLIVVATATAGTMFLMWLGDQITSKGIGNGISIIIFVGIVAGLPSAITTIWNLIFGAGAFSTTGLLIALAIIIGAIILVAGVVFVQQAERRVPVQYSKRVVGRKMVGAQNTNIPLKLAMAGVMPVIFASSFMTFPAMIIQMFNPNIQEQAGFWNVIYNFSIATSTSSVAIGYSIANAIVYLLLIVGFTYFYTYATFNPAEVSNNIKKNGGFIPGIRAGKPTTDYLSSIISIPGSFLPSNNSKEAPPPVEI